MYPLAIQEWKYNELQPTDRDAQWLRIYSRNLADFVGYIVQISRSGRTVQLKSPRVHQGEIDPLWLILPE